MSGELYQGQENWRYVKIWKERPECREIINQLLEQKQTLEEMAQGYYIENDKKTFLTKGLRSQARKMLLEQQEK